MGGPVGWKGWGKGGPVGTKEGSGRAKEGLWVEVAGLRGPVGGRPGWGQRRAVYADELK